MGGGGGGAWQERGGGVFERWIDTPKHAMIDHMYFIYIKDQLVRTENFLKN